MPTQPLRFGFWTPKTGLRHFPGGFYFIYQIDLKVQLLSVTIPGSPLMRKHGVVSHCHSGPLQHLVNRPRWRVLAKHRSQVDWIPFQAAQPCLLYGLGLRLSKPHFKKKTQFLHKKKHLLNIYYVSGILLGTEKIHFILVKVGEERNKENK